MRRATLALQLALLVTGSLAAAQPAPLAALAPAETVLTLGWTPGPPLQNALTRDLAALDWARAGRTLEALAPLADDPSSESLLSMYGYLLQGGRGEPPQGGDMFAACSEWRALERTSAPMPDLTLDAAYDAALLSVSASSYNPVPAVTAMLRVEPAVEAQFAAVQRALVRCSERSGTETLRLLEGDVPMIVFGNAGDFPVVLSRVGPVFIVGTNPEVVRGVLRRLAGSEEASLAQTPLYRRNRALLEGNGVSVALDAAALGSAVESLGGTLVDAQTEPLLRRAVAALRTLGSYAGTLRLGDDLRLESRLNVDPEGGDPELAARLLCRCPAPVPTLAPERSVSVSTGYLQPRRVFDYLGGWAEVAGRAAGEEVSLRELSWQTLGLDLDVALLDWLGNEIVSIVLEPVIRTAQGYGRALADDEAFLGAWEDAPQNVTRLAYSAVSAQLQGLADLIRLALQPLAFAAAAGLSEMAGKPSRSAEPPGLADLLHLSELLPDVLTVLSENTDTLVGYTWVEGDARRSRMHLGLG